MKFRDRAEAAALLAALSRFLRSPQADAMARNSLEIRGCAGANRETAFFVSGAALAAIGTAFAPAPPTVIFSEKEIPKHAVVLLDQVTPAWGWEEAQSRLAEAIGREDGAQD